MKKSLKEKCDDSFTTNSTTNKNPQVQLRRSPRIMNKQLAMITCLCLCLCLPVSIHSQIIEPINEGVTMKELNDTVKLIVGTMNYKVETKTNVTYDQLKIREIVNSFSQSCNEVAVIHPYILNGKDVFLFSLLQMMTIVSVNCPLSMFSQVITQLFSVTKK